MKADIQPELRKRDSWTVGQLQRPAFPWHVPPPVRIGDFVDIHPVAICALGMLLLTVVVLLHWNRPPLTLAAPPALPERPTPIPTATPFQQPTPTSTFNPPSTSSKTGAAKNGAYIALRVGTGTVQQPARVGAQDFTSLWTIIQWQDTSGDWHDVEGWQGSLEQHTTKIWWLPDYLFGAGPFRWRVTRERGGVVLGTSEPFTLPQTANKTLWVDVTW